MKEFTLGKNSYEFKQCDQCFSQVGNLRNPERFQFGKNLMNVNRVASVLLAYHS